MNTISKRRFLTSALGMAFLLPGQSLGAFATSHFKNSDAAISDGHSISAPTLGFVVARMAVSLLGQRIGRGECTDLADKALALAGAQTGRDYVWGKLVPNGSKIKRGDIIQFWDTRFTGPAGQMWGTSEGGQHTAVILAVSGTVLNLVHQNFPAGSSVVRGSIDLSWSHTGSYNIYRPIAL